MLLYFLVLMFDYQKLTVYKKAKSFNKDHYNFIKTLGIPKHIKDQLNRASFSILLNIAEGSGRFTSPDKKNFYVISRGSVFECAAIFDYLLEIEMIESEEFLKVNSELEEISKMLYALIQLYDKKTNP